MIDHLAGPLFAAASFTAVLVWFRLSRGRLMDMVVRALYRLSRVTWCLARAADQAVITYRMERSLNAITADCEEVRP